MKTLLFAILALIFTTSHAQSVNFCDYFSLEVSQSNYEGKMYQSANPIVLENIHDPVSLFIKKHAMRFQYVLFNYTELWDTISSFYPDNNRIHDEFCKLILNDFTVKKYLIELTPNKLTHLETEKQKFTVHELMAVASKFFYCDTINQTDTSIQSHVCIGINGLKDLQTTRDLTVLEAFSIEAIFHYLMKSRLPSFYRDFEQEKKHLVQENLKNFKNFESYLIAVRKGCYVRMENNVDLKNKLLAYYQKNIDNLNFVIDN